MSADAHEFRDLLLRVRAGDESAVAVLLTHYREPLLRIIRGHLIPLMRRRFDSADFLQDVWASFFARSAAVNHFETPELFLAFLGSLARNKVRKATRNAAATQKRDMRRESYLDDSQCFDRDVLVSCDPTPSQEVSARERWDDLINRQPPHYRLILTLLRDGHSYEEVAAELGVSRKTVHRFLQRVAPEFATP